MAIKEHRFSDINMNLNTTAGGDVKLVYGVDSVTQSIKTILSTYPGERIMNPEFGSNMRDFLFEPMNQFTLERMEIEIRRAIEEWEDRVRILQIRVLPDEDNNIYDINIDYRLITTGQIANFRGKVRALND